VTGNINCLKILANGNVAFDTTRVYIYNYATGSDLTSGGRESGSTITSMELQKDTKTLVCGLQNGDIKLFVIASLAFTATLSGHTAQVNVLASIDTNYFVSGSDDQNIITWDLSALSVVKKTNLASGQIKSLIYGVNEIATG
jgi:WD40 repeat protein